MRSIYRLLILGAFLYHSQLSAAIPINASSPEPEAITQGKLTITGVVIDKATGESLPSVAVMVKGTSVGSLTDADGKFSIQVPDRNATLVFTFVSYQKKDIFYFKSRQAVESEQIIVTKECYPVTTCSFTLFFF